MVSLTDVQSLPDSLPQREATMLGWVKKGDADFSYTEIDCGGGLIVRAFSDALKFAGVRINASATLEQQIADELDCMLLTPMLADLVWANAAKTIEPFPLGASDDMASTAKMLKESALISKSAEGAPAGILSTVGKHWVLVKKLTPSKAANYGWHFRGTWVYSDPLKKLVQTNAQGPANFGGMKGEAPVTNLGNVRVLQGVGTAHDPFHADYSQTVVLVARDCMYEGKKMRLSDVLADANLAKYVSSEGPLSFDRQPGVPLKGSGGKPIVPSPPPKDPVAKIPPPIKGTPASVVNTPPAAPPVETASVNPVVAFLLFVGACFGLAKAKR